MAYAEIILTTNFAFNFFSVKMVSSSASDSAASIRGKTMEVLGHGFNYYNLIKPKPPYGASKRKMSMPVKQCIR